MNAPSYRDLAKKLGDVCGAPPPDLAVEAIQLLTDLDFLENRIRSGLENDDMNPARLLAMIRESFRDNLEFAKQHPELAERVLNPNFRFRQGASGVTGDALNDPDVRDVRIDTETWYEKAHRLLDIGNTLAPLRGLDCLPLRVVRNWLLTHPEKPQSGITRPSFGWNTETGPQIKASRAAGQEEKWMDKGLYPNSEALRAAIERALQRNAPGS